MYDDGVSVSIIGVSVSIIEVCVVLGGQVSWTGHAEPFTQLGQLGEDIGIASMWRLQHRQAHGERVTNDRRLGLRRDTCAPLARLTHGFQKKQGVLTISKIK